MKHGLCWVHIERGLRKLEGNTEPERENITQMQGLLWEYYQELKAWRVTRPAQYQQQPSRENSLSLQDKFDEIFGRCYIRHGLLNDVLNQIRNRKIELLQVLKGKMRLSSVMRGCWRSRVTIPSSWGIAAMDCLWNILLDR
jgi:hypothetical protein